MISIPDNLQHYILIIIDRVIDGTDQHYQGKQILVLQTALKQKHAALVDQ